MDPPDTATEIAKAPKTTLSYWLATEQRGRIRRTESAGRFFPDVLLLVS